MSGILFLLVILGMILLFTVAFTFGSGYDDGRSKTRAYQNRNNAWLAAIYDAGYYRAKNRGKRIIANREKFERRYGKYDN